MALAHDEITVYHPEHLHQNNDADTRRQHALKRASELKGKIKDYLASKTKFIQALLVEKSRSPLPYFELFQWER